MKYIVLASGSAGNATFIDFDGYGILVDCGISKRRIANQLSSHGYSFNDIKAVFLTHDHSDHNRNIHLFDPCIVYAGKDSYKCQEGNVLIGYQPFFMHDLTIIPVSTSHDAHSPLGFVFIKGNQKLVYITDTGYISEMTMQYIKNADYYIFESNHDIEMLMNTSRPLYLKNRILSDKGHLSNEDSAMILSLVLGEDTKEIVLAHISREANTKELALSAYDRVFRQRHVDMTKLSIKAADQELVLVGGSYED